MDAVNELNKTHGVKQRGGKMYTQVVHRMEAFRRHFGISCGVNTSVLVDDGQRVVIKAIITNADGIQIGSGMAEEIRGQGHVNTTSALENAETSAIGRALSSIGLAGGEYASANEIDAVSRKEEAKKDPAPVPTAAEVAKKEAPKEITEEVRKAQLFMGEVNAKLPNLKLFTAVKEYMANPWVKENMKNAELHAPELYKMIRDRFVLRVNQVKVAGE
tara:strand:+ start:623 stop:1273 length:651 start_codon:yes stop_codon:yes gene_type:complete